jgi:hypothetical protein
MHLPEAEDLVKSLARRNLFFQAELCGTPAALASVCSELDYVFGCRRNQFRNLHFGYDPVPEIYLQSKEFDRFFPPRSYLDQLGYDREIEHFIEGLGCYLEPTEEQDAELNSILKIPFPHPSTQNRKGVVLMCWDRVDATADKLCVSVLDLLCAVGFHEHSHAACSAKVLKGGSVEILRAEETIAQWETYMFLQSRKHPKAQTAIEAMKKLMQEQPDCYKIPI